jgi:hypothetical protein
MTGNFSQNLLSRIDSDIVSEFKVNLEVKKKGVMSKYKPFMEASSKERQPCIETFL